VCANWFGVEDLGAMNAEGVFPYVAVGIATTHSMFNITNTLVFLPFTNVFAKLLDRVVKSRPEKPSAQFTHLSPSMLESSFLASRPVDSELTLMFQDLKSSMETLSVCFEKPSEAKQLGVGVFETEERFDKIKGEIDDYLAKLIVRFAPSTPEAHRQLHICEELESAADHIAQILKIRLRLLENNIDFSKDEIEALLGLHNMVFELLPMVREYFKSKNAAQQVAIDEKCHEITAQVRALRTAHWHTLETGQLPPLAATSFSDMLISYRKIMERFRSIANAVMGIA
jgi:phosphate:Na+ symporter